MRRLVGSAGMGCIAGIRGFSAKLNPHLVEQIYSFVEFHGSNN